MGTRHWPEDADEAVEKLEEEVSWLRAELAKESARMDWLENVDECYWVQVQAQHGGGKIIYSGQGYGLREAIDKVMEGNDGTVQSNRCSIRHLAELR